MNNHHEFEKFRQLDRLVDGELSRDEYYALLETLDQEPDGWRRCAMAFLEAQVWRHEFDALRVEGRSSCHETSSQFVRPRVSNWSTRQIVGLLLAMAASFAVAFASGIWWHVGDSPSSELDIQKVARRAADSHHVALKDELPREPEREHASDDAPAEHLTFVVDRGNGESDRFELPIYEANDSAARQLLQDSPSMPADVERAIRDSGFHVQSQRQWAPVRLHDGRRVFFPVDQVDITPVSASIYH
jgi:hypothetical protein